MLKQLIDVGFKTFVWVYLALVIAFVGLHVLTQAFPKISQAGPALLGTAGFLGAIASMVLAFARDEDNADFKAILRRRASYLLATFISIGFAAALHFGLMTSSPKWDLHPLLGIAVAQMTVYISIGAIFILVHGFSVLNLYFPLHFLLNRHRADYQLEQSRFPLERPALQFFALIAPRSSNLFEPDLSKTEVFP